MATDVINTIAINEPTPTHRVVLDDASMLVDTDLYNGRKGLRKVKMVLEISQKPEKLKFLSWYPHNIELQPDEETTVDFWNYFSEF